MERIDEPRADELIDLGSVTDQTKGMGGFYNDGQDGLQISPRLTDD
ncbi:hypothetical protein GG804_02240 [Sphingomonas histidinilytica]|nr:hypothetical protein [Rhizorhabdus histidinilytica]MBO9375574.1 hypothetical protein [Rhizorhabdus histidinilytica]